MKDLLSIIHNETAQRRTGRTTALANVARSLGGTVGGVLVCASTAQARQVAKDHRVDTMAFPTFLNNGLQQRVVIFDHFVVAQLAHWYNDACDTIKELQKELLPTRTVLRSRSRTMAISWSCDPVPNNDTIALLTTALEQAKEGYIQDAVLVYTTNERSVSYTAVKDTRMWALLVSGLERAKLHLLLRGTPGEDWTV